MKIKIILFVVILSLPATIFLSCQSGSNKPTDKQATISSDNTVKATPDTSISQPASSDSDKTKPVTAVKATKGTVSSVMKINKANKDGEVFPQFPGGQAALDKFIATNVVYPPDAIEERVEGTVIVEFEIDKMGLIYTPHVTSEKLGYGLETEAMKVVNKMPLWTPASIKGKNTKSHYRLPVTFKLD